uniref:Uncharacterized protein n=1 Tax=Anguilla anguilla TaxID=7936 RepID=A0A0E9UDD3_ANGAN
MHLAPASGKVSQFQRAGSPMLCDP